MPRFRFSLLALFGFVGVTAVVFAALASPNESWLMITKGLTLGCLFFSALAGIYGHRVGRAFWVGFAVVGWGYFVVQQEFEPPQDLPTGRISDRLQRLIHPDGPLIQLGDSHNPPIQPANWLKLLWFKMILTWLWPLVLGFVGGLIACHLYLRRERERLAMPKK
jgi:hypothetical protein